VKKVEAFIRPFKLEEVKRALSGAGVNGLTVSQALGRWRNETCTDTYRGLAYTIDLTPKIKLEVVVPDCRADQVISLIIGAARDGRSEAGTIVVSPVEDVIGIRTGEHGEGVVW
jgi:nitrogen regulatory protein P-II 1